MIRSFTTAVLHAWLGIRSGLPNRVVPASCEVNEPSAVFLESHRVEPVLRWSQACAELDQAAKGPLACEWSACLRFAVSSRHVCRALHHHSKINKMITGVKPWRWEDSNDRRWHRTYPRFWYFSGTSTRASQYSETSVWSGPTTFRLDELGASWGTTLIRTAHEFSRLTCLVIHCTCANYQKWRCRLVDIVLQLLNTLHLRQQAQSRRVLLQYTLAPAKSARVQ